MCILVYSSDVIVFFISYISEKNNFKNKFIIKKKDIKRAVDRNRMRRKMRFLCKILPFNSNICHKVIIKKLYEFNISEYTIIKDKIIKNACIRGKQYFRNKRYRKRN